MAGSMCVCVCVCVCVCIVSNLGNWAVSLKGQLHLQKKESATQIAMGRAVWAEGTLCKAKGLSWERVWCV